MDGDELYSLLEESLCISENPEHDLSHSADSLPRCETCKNLAFVSSRPPKEYSYTETRRVADSLMDLTPNIGHFVRLPNGDFGFSVMPGHKPPHPPLSQWFQSAKEGCKFCQLVLDAIQAALPVWLWSKGNKFVSTQAILGLPLQILLTNASQQLMYAREGALEIFTRPEQPQCWTTFGYSGYVCERNDSDEAFAKIRRWMKDCENNHATCRAPNTKFMPSRVIDVGSQGSSDIICLVEPKVYDPYIALSYCWGTTKRSWLVTTKENINAHRKSIPQNRLPWTLFNAINFTKRLGIRYIWIDSLCIVQDDKIDWTTEAAKMSDVYFHATLVVSANSTPDCTIPSFHDQHYGSRYCQTTFRPRPGFGPCNEVYVRTSSVVNHMNQGRVSRPRDSRGWCFQESALARRELQLTSFEMQWTCAEIEKCECLESHPTPITGLLKALKASSRSYFKQPTNEHPEAEELYTIWRLITLLYTQRAFTNQSDKLVAISSLAHVIRSALTEAHGIDETYLAGLWKGDLARGLLWLPNFQREAMGQRRGHLGALFLWRFLNSGFFSVVIGHVLDIRDIFVEKLSNCFRRVVALIRKEDQSKPHLLKPQMPTWSWASTSLPVTYFLGVQSPLLETETFKSEIEIHEAEVETSPLNICGPAESGHIRLTGQMVEVHLRTLPEPPIDYLQRRIGPYSTPIHRPYDLVSFVCTEGNAVQECVLDRPIMKICPPVEEKNWDCWFGFDGRQCDKTDCSCRLGWSKETYWCVKIGTARGPTKPGHIILIPFWLILKKSEGREVVYERVGMGSAECVGRSP